jgi:hypothetical protein
MARNHANDRNDIGINSRARELPGLESVRIQMQ